MIAVGVSSSVIVSVAVPGSRPVALPLSTTVSLGSASVSFVGVKLNVAVPLVACAAIVTVKLLIAS